MNQQQPILTNRVTSQIDLIDPTPITQSEFPTAVILAIAILISILVNSITKLVRVIVVNRSVR
jgi:hypothetical protein